MDEFKRVYSNEEESKSIAYFWEHFDKENYSIWFGEYKYNNELQKVFMSCNLISGKIHVESIFQFRHALLWSYYGQCTYLFEWYVVFSFGKISLIQLFLKVSLISFYVLFISYMCMIITAVYWFWCICEIAISTKILILNVFKDPLKVLKSFHLKFLIIRSELKDLEVLFKLRVFASHIIYVC